LLEVAVVGLFRHDASLWSGATVRAVGWVAIYNIRRDITYGGVSMSATTPRDDPVLNPAQLLKQLAPVLALRVKDRVSCGLRRVRAS